MNSQIALLGAALIAGFSNGQTTIDPKLFDCPLIGYDIDGGCLDPVSCPAGQPDGQGGQPVDGCPCNNLCFKTDSWEECASQCSEVTDRVDVGIGQIPKGYVAWSYQTRGTQGGSGTSSYIGNCCCKNTLVGMEESKGTIMGLPNCLGSGRLV